MEVFSCLSEAKQRKIRELIHERSSMLGQLAELGVYKGGNALNMARANPDKELFLFDTFMGIPSKGEFDIHDVGDFKDTELKEVQTLLLPYKTRFVVGTFPDSIDAWPLIFPSFQVVHIDADQYEVTKFALNFFFEKLVTNGVIILDDYEWDRCPGVKKAIQEFLKRNSKAHFVYQPNEVSNQAYIYK